MYHPLVQALYVAYFGRPADPGGLSFYSKLYLQAGAPTSATELGVAYGRNPHVKALVDSFSSSKESQDLYPGNNSEFLTKIYENIFGRAPDQAGHDFWLRALQSGAMTRANAVVEILGGMQGSDSALFGYKTEFAQAFTLKVSAGSDLYSGLDANVIVRTTLNAIVSPQSLEATARSIDAVVAALTERIAPMPLTGYAQMDTPMAGATIHVQCINGFNTAATASNTGFFSVSLPSTVYPCFVSARGVGDQTGFTFHGAAISESVIRVSPLTDAVLAKLYSKNVALLDFGKNSPHFASLMSSKIANAVQQVRSLIPSSLTMPGGDPFIVSEGAISSHTAFLRSLRDLLVEGDMDWEDALDFVIAGEQLDEPNAFLTNMSPDLVLPGDIVTITGQNLPVSPVPTIVLISSSGSQVAAEIVGLDTSTIKFRVPSSVQRGNYDVLANGYKVFLGVFVNIPNPAANHPFYQSGPQRNRIGGSFKHMADGINRGPTGTLLGYPGRIRKGLCSVRINDDGSITRLGKDGEALKHYSWESRNDDPNRPYPMLYEEPNPRASRVEIVPRGLSIPDHSFVFHPAGTSSSDVHTFDMCVGPQIDSGFQFFAGPAISNWAKFKDGTYPSTGSSWAMVGNEYSFYKRVHSKVLNRSFGEGMSSYCGLTIKDGKVSVWLENENSTIATFAFSDNFKYEPPINYSDFTQSEVFIEPTVPKALNFRLLSEKPFVSSSVKFLLEFSKPDMGILNQAVVLYFGIENYDHQPGYFDYEGYLMCTVQNIPLKTP